jgi:hypothetical protein
MRPAALVVSPFASVPRDAGHRRRVHQMTKLLAARGYSVTFLLLAFEDDWAWAHDAELRTELAAEWDDVIVVHAADHVGRPPVSGATHALDEWWDASLQATLTNLATRRFFDVVVVHNVWLTKVFDFVHRGCTKVLETHDLFWKRADAFARIGAPPAFFIPDRESELFGLARADIVVTIQAAEARELLELTPRRIVNVPFYDDELHRTADGAPAVLHHPEKVSFGFLASANPFNIHGANALLAALEVEIAETFAPVEIVVGGSVGKHLRTRLPIRRLGRVPTEAGFYAGLDYAIAPVFEGTGFKIKTADALALARPLLAASHATEGAEVDRSLVCVTPAEMAALMARIALRRPDPKRAQAHVMRAREGLRTTAADGEAQLIRAIARSAAPVIIDLSETSAETAAGALRLQAWLSVMRVLATQDLVLLVLPQSVRVRIERLLPPGVRAIAAGEVAAVLALWPRCRRLDAAAMAAPPLHPNLLWEAACLRLREMWAETPAGRASLGDDAALVILYPGARASRFRTGRTIMTVDASDEEAVAVLLLRLLTSANDGVEIACSAVASRVRDALLDTCALRRIAFSGFADDTAYVRGVPHGARTGELARRAAAMARSLAAEPIFSLNPKESLCLAA